MFKITSDGEAADNGKAMPQSFEKTGGLFKRIALFLVFGNRIRLRNKTEYITYMSVIVTLALIISAIKGDIGSLKISFNYIPCFIAGIYFGPLFAVCVGLMIPIGQFFFVGYWPWALNMVGFALMGLLMSLFVQGIKAKKIGVTIKIIFGAAAVCLAVTLGVNTVAFMVEPVNNMYFGWSYFEILFLSAPPRILFQPLILVINTVITIFLVKGLDYAYFKQRKGDGRGNKKAARPRL